MAKKVTTAELRRKMAQAKKVIAEIKQRARFNDSWDALPVKLRQAIEESRKLGRELERRRDVAFYLKVAAVRAEQDAAKVAKRWKTASDRVQRMLEARRKKEERG